MVERVDIIERIEDVITDVYRTRTVKPWDDGTERAYYFEMQFRERLSNWPLRNLTDLVFGGSTVLIFLMHPGHYFGVPTKDGIEILIKRLGGECYQVLVEISHLGPFARIRFTRETKDPLNGKFTYEESIEAFRLKDNDFYFALLNILKTDGIEVLSEEILEIPVPDVELDVTGPGQATIYHCLFDEE